MGNYKSTIKLALLLISTLGVVPTAFAVAYTYPGGGTPFTSGGTLNASTGDSLTIIADSSGFSATTAGVGDISILTGGTFNVAGTGFTLGNSGNFTIAANLTFSSTAFLTPVVSSSTNGNNTQTIFNNGTITASNTSGANGITSTGSTARNINNTGSISASSVDAFAFQGGFGVNIGSDTSSLTLTNSGTINGTSVNNSGFGVVLSGSTTLTNTSNISGSATFSAAGVLFNATQAADTIINNGGTISGTVSFTPGIGAGIYNISSQINTITNNNGIISGTTHSIYNASGTVNANLNGGTLTGAISGTNILTFGGGVSTTVTGNISTSQFIVNALATAVVDGTIASTTFTNSGTTILKSIFTQANVGTFTNTGTLAFDGNNAAISGNLTGDGTGSIVFGQVTPTTNFSLTSIISGFPNVTIASGSTVTVSTNGQFSGTSTITVTGTLTNNAALSIGSGLTMAGNGTISNNIGKTLTLAGGSFTGAGTLSNNGVLAISNDTDMTTTAVNTSATGSVTVSGNRVLNAASYANSGAQNFSITNQSTYDSLTCDCAVNVSGSINVSSSLLATDTSSWQILTASSGNLTAVAPTLPSDSLFAEWSYIDDLTTLTVYQTQINTFVGLADSTLNREIAAVLQAMAENITNSGQQTLISAFLQSSNSADYNNNLHQMLPNFNANSTNVMQQNSALNKVELRLIGLRDDNQPTGVAFGTLNCNAAIWAGGFGSIAQQNPLDLNDGYTAKSLGSIYGIDYRSDFYDVYGLAFAVANTNVYELSNADFVTRILGFNAMLYGSTIINTDTLFTEWMILGAVNKNKGSRSINVSGNNFSVDSSYHNYQGGIRFNFGQITGSNSWTFSLVETLRYTFSYNPDYNEAESVAALNVQPQKFTNLLTLGGGVRLSLPGADPWYSGSSEIRVMGTYDVVRPQNTTYANFLVGSENFAVQNPISPWGVEFGADFTCVFFDQIQIQFSYDFTLRNQYTNNSASIKLRYIF